MPLTFRADDSFNDGKRSMLAALARDFQGAHDSSRCYEDLRPVYDFGRNGSFEAFTSQKRHAQSSKGKVANVSPLLVCCITPGWTFPNLILIDPVARPEL